MEISKAFLAAVAYATDEVIPKLASKTDRFLAYGAIAAYRGRVDKIISDNSSILSSIGILKDGKLETEKLKEVVSFAFSKEPEIDFHIPIIDTTLKFNSADFDKFMQYIEVAGQ